MPYFARFLPLTIGGLIPLKLRGSCVAALKIHKVAILAFDDVVPADLTTPCEIFARVELACEHLPYQVQVCSPARLVKTHAFNMHTKWSLDAAIEADTVIVPGMANPTDDPPAAIIKAICEAKASGARIVSICTGAFILAASGILEGLNVTTHWRATDLLARLYPNINVQPNVLFTDNGQILSSAGAAAGVDLCLYLIKKDFGAAVAASAARLAVVPLERSGGQAQFIVRNAPVSHTNLSPILQWIESRLGRSITLTDISDYAAVSIRTLSRRFQEQLGTSPLQWVIQARVTRAQAILETSDISVERVAIEVGFGSAASLREHFLQIVGTSPTAYRQIFRKKPVNFF